MKTTTLHQDLLNAYSVENLNNISLILIRLYKDRQFGVLKKMAAIINDIVDIEIRDDGKGFSKFMMLYHPDRVRFHLDVINGLAEQDDLDGLMQFSHILLLEKIEEIASSLDGFEDIDYSPVYEWDFETDGFSIVNDFEPPQKTKTNVVGCDFYDAIKKRNFENTSFHYPPHYLQDLDEFELSSCCIIHLDGVENCIHAQEMDLSDNMIFDLELLAGLSRLEILNLSDNEIENIDPLSNLLNLKTLILTNNKIKDISPLFDLPKLEYVNISGNNVEVSQIAILAEMGVEVEQQ
jgi:hypothetical protein